MVGASIVVKGSVTGTQTGADGTFKISVPNAAGALLISSVGYATQEVSIKTSTSLNVALATTNDQLNEVVVIGYGTARKKDLTGAVVSVQAKNFNQGAIMAPDQLLQSKVAGLEVTNSNWVTKLAVVLPKAGLLYIPNELISRLLEAIGPSF